MIELDESIIYKIMEKIKNPEGVDVDTPFLNDHNILFWSLNNLQVMMTKREFGDYKGKWTVIVSNVDYKDLIRPEVNIKECKGFLMFLFT